MRKISGRVGAGAGLLLAGLLVTAPAAAQDASEVERRAHPGHGGMAAMVLRQADALELTDAQRAELEALRDGAAAETAPLRERMRAMHAEHAEAVRGILTEDQLSELREHRRQGRQGRPMAGRPGPRHQRGIGAPGPARGGMGSGMVRSRMADVLELTEEQRAAFRELSREFRSAHGAEGLSPEDRRAAAESYRESLREILTPEQMERLESMRRHPVVRRQGSR